VRLQAPRLCPKVSNQPGVRSKKPERSAPALRTLGDKLELAAQLAAKQPCEA
jgi:hypothetical protein